MKVIVTGSFDPITLGHLEIIKYASEKYDEVYVVALNNEKKSYMFTLNERKELIRLSVEELPNVVVDAYSGMTADYMHEHGINLIVRGVRNSTDEEYFLGRKLTKIPTMSAAITATTIIRIQHLFRLFHRKPRLISCSIIKPFFLCDLRVCQRRQNVTYYFTIYMVHLSSEKLFVSNKKLYNSVDIFLFNKSQNIF